MSCMIICLEYITTPSVLPELAKFSTLKSITYVRGNLAIEFPINIVHGTKIMAPQLKYLE